MSTLKVNTIQNTSAAHSSTPEQISKGRAKVWVIYDIDGGINANYGVSSVTDNGAGSHTVNFSTNFANVNYAYAVSYSRGTGTNGRVLGQEGSDGKQVDKFQIRVRNVNNLAIDTPEVSAVFFDNT